MGKKKRDSCFFAGFFFAGFPLFFPRIFAGFRNFSGQKKVGQKREFNQKAGFYVLGKTAIFARSRPGTYTVDKLVTPLYSIDLSEGAPTRERNPQGLSRGRPQSPRTSFFNRVLIVFCLCIRPRWGYFK